MCPAVPAWRLLRRARWLHGLPGPGTFLGRRTQLSGIDAIGDYSLEYGQNELEIHRDSLARCKRVVIVDDLLATGGTAAAAAELVRRRGAELMAFLFVIELSALEGRAPLGELPVISLLQYD